MRKRYRIYIDEVGNSDLGSSEDPNHRFLSLTGIILDYKYYADKFVPYFDKLRNSYFHSHPDEPVILHRKELVNKKGAFRVLRDQSVGDRFDVELLRLIAECDYTVISVVIDKKEHKDKYEVWRFDPYHYCMNILVERYIFYLRAINAIGDVMTESRGKKDDQRLKKSFSRIYSEGTDFMKPEIIQEHLTSKELKVKPKSADIRGLQFADLIAHPSYRYIIEKNFGIENKAPFGKKIIELLKNKKYYRSKGGTVDGYGIKILP